MPKASEQASDCPRVRSEAPGESPAPQPSPQALLWVIVEKFQEIAKEPEVQMVWKLQNLTIPTPGSRV